ncbi:helix-turn-helix domain-containing protein [Rhizobium alvei]|uniref:Helix-turn-helix domain-containing protein n=1 Tax=Rhizobium alvei TaxID=1132659 RepID=A0ABT8YQJ7_9HYPH|nr:helix-turn-helix domain-containing protein [Rhizobium alvei]MDO6965897.1 helix-turn-helix domain-containing protein [Rhizobium alvei]
MSRANPAWMPARTGTVRASHPIPDIDVMGLCGGADAAAEIQYESINRLAELMGRSPAPHRHIDCLQIHFIEAGQYDFTLDESRYTGAGPAIFLTPPGVPHAFTLCGDAVGHVLTIRQDLLWAMARQHDLPLQRERLLPFCAGFAGPRGQGAARSIAASLDLLRSELGSDGASATARLLVAFVVTKVIDLRTESPLEAVSGNRQISLYRRFLDLLEQHHADHWAIAHYADQLNITQSRLYELCLHNAARSPKSILNDRLVQEARRYLSFSDSSMKEIAGILGFEDVNYFFRFFKRLTGETPSQCRQRTRLATPPENVQ